MIDRLKLTEESRISFVKFHFEKFAKLIEEHTHSTNELLSRLNNSLVEIKIEEDLKLFDEKFNFLYKTHERIPREEFLNYDIYRRNMDKLITSHFIQNDSTGESDLDTSVISTQDDKKSFIDRFFRDIRTKDIEISMDDITFIIDKVCSSTDFSKMFVDRLLTIYKNAIYVSIPNYQNFFHLSNILLNISSTLEVGTESFGINFAVIFIAEKTYYVNPENKLNKVYLCSILSKNRALFNKSFWTALLDIKITNDIDKKVYNEARKMHSSASISTTLDKNKPGYFDRMKFFLTPSKKINHKENIPAPIFNDIKTIEATNILSIFIMHFANFNFDVSTAIDIIVEYAAKYDIDKDRVSYLISSLNSNMFSIRNKSNLQGFIDINNVYFNRDFKKYMSLNDNVISIFAYTFRYLKNEDYLSIVCLNKTFNRKLSRILYKNILLKYHNMDKTIRLKLWSNLLKVVREINNRTISKAISIIGRY
jgi:hypothetical protein